MELISFLNLTFWQSSGYFVLFLLSLIYILCQKKGEIRGKYMAVYTIGCAGIVIYNPIVGQIALDYFMEDKMAYLRVFYLIPLMSLIAYAMVLYYTEHVKRTDKKGKKLGFIFLFSFVIFLSGKFYDDSMFLKAQNIYKLDSEVLYVADELLAMGGEEKVRIILPENENLEYGIRQYTGGIVLAGHTDTIKDEISLWEIHSTLSYQYALVEKGSRADKAFAASAYEPALETDTYRIYKRTV